MKIGEFAKKAGVNPKTIRYYEGIGLLPPAPRTGSGYRQYAEDDAERLEFIRSAKALGVALEEIKEVLAFRDRGTYPCPYVLTLIDTKVKEIESRIRGLRMLADDLKRLRKAAAIIPPEELAAKTRFCHIIENQKLLQVSERPPGAEKTISRLLPFGVGGRGYGGASHDSRTDHHHRRGRALPKPRSSQS